MSTYFPSPIANSIQGQTTRPNSTLIMPSENLRQSSGGSMYVQRESSPILDLYSTDVYGTNQLNAKQVSNSAHASDNSPTLKYRRLSDSSAVSSNPSETNFPVTSTKAMPIPIDIVGATPRNLTIAEKYAVEGATEYVYTGAKLSSENHPLPPLPQWRRSIDIPFFEEDFGGGFDPDVSIAMQLRQIHQSLMKTLNTDMVYIDQLLIEIFASHKLISDYDLMVLSPSRDIWAACQEFLIRKLVNYIFEKGLLDTDEPLETCLSQNFMNEIVHSHFIPMINQIRSATSNCVAFRKLQDRQDGKFAADYEPSRKELDTLKTIPQCAVRGVGWNGSTRAWVASWLPPNGHKRVCATYSTRKFGYHRAMKLAICQRLRAELFVYKRRKYPVFLQY